MLEEKSVAATKTFILTLLVILKIVYNALDKNIDGHIEMLSNNLIKTLIINGTQQY